MSITISHGDDGVHALTLVGTDADGILDTAAIRALAAHLRDLVREPSLRALVIRGNDGMFCRGRRGAKGLIRASDVAHDLNAILEVNAALDALPAPVIAAIEGEALGFGFGIAAQSDYAIASESAVFALPEMSHGLPPLVVLSYLFRFVPYKRAMELAISSRRIGAAEAQQTGIVTEIVGPGEAVARAMEIGRRMAAFDPKSLSLLRRFARHAAAAHTAHLSEHAVALMSVLLAENAQAAADAATNAAAVRPEP